MSHSLLQQQISQHLDASLLNDPRMAAFLEAVSLRYEEADSKNKCLEELAQIKQTLFETQQFASIGTFEIDYINQSSSFSEQAALLLGLPEAELININSLFKNLRRNVVSEDMAMIDKVWLQAISTKTDFRLDFALNHPVKEHLTYIDWIAKLKFDSKGRLIKIMGTIQDITERKRNSELLKEHADVLEKINKELDQFAYIVSHDLKAPLRAIFNLSEWIQEDLEGKMNDETSKNFDLLRGRIKRMESLIEGILQYSRAGRIKAETEIIDLHFLVQDIVFNLAPPEKFKIEIQQEMPVINCERIAVEQVFSNFISNAIKYNTASEPLIKISCDNRENDLLFCVADNGPGIEPEFHEKVFQIFQTLQARDVMESTGVGLAIVKKIIEEKGGQVWVESEPGNGAKFCFTMPKKAA